MKRAALGLVLLALVGCSSRENQAGVEAAKPAPAPPDAWSVTCTDPADLTPVVLWNGWIGVRIGRDGSGVGLPFFMIDSYETEGEEKILSLPNPLAVSWKSGDEVLSPANSHAYRQTLDFKTGILLTAWTGRTKAGKPYEFQVETAIDPVRRILAQRFEINGSGQEWTLVDGINVRSYLDSIVTFAPSGEKAYVKYVGGSTLKDGDPVSRIVSIGAGSASAELRKLRPLSKLVPKEEQMPTYEQVVEASRTSWAKRWKTDIVIDGPVEDQQAIHSFLFYLRSAIAPGGPMSISPCGLSNQQYSGHVFWDADIWVFPALALVEPDEAKTISDYRLQLAANAHLNLGMNMSAAAVPPGEVSSSIKFPWESSVSGKEVAPGESRKEIHISGSVAWTLFTAECLGLAPSGRVQTVGRSVAAGYLHRLSGKPPYDVKNVMSPDESHVGDNDLYTNLLVQWVGKKFKIPNTNWVLKLPQDKTSFLTYDNDPVRGYKQAAAVLAIYPLQYPPAEKQAEVMMNRFADKVTPNGPAMSDSVHALIWARLGKTGVAYTTWRKSWMDFTNHPLLLFSEKRKKDVTYFTTGAAGCLQTVLYGFLGFRIDEEKEPGAAWSKQLLGGRWLSIRPHLPDAWKAVTFKNFSLLGKRYTLTADHESVTVSQGVP